MYFYTLLNLILFFNSNFSLKIHKSMTRVSENILKTFLLLFEKNNSNMFMRFFDLFFLTLHVLQFLLYVYNVQLSHFTYCPEN